MHGSGVVSYSKKKRLGNRNRLGHMETSDDREEGLQLGAGGAGPGRAMDEGKVSQIGSWKAFFP